MPNNGNGRVARVAAAAGLGLTLALGAAPVAALAEGVEQVSSEGAVSVGDPAALESALGSGGTIQLSNDITCEDALSVDNSISATIDLNGKTLDLGSSTISVSGSLTIIDSSTPGVPVVSEDGSYSVTYSSGKIVSSATVAIAVDGGTITVEGGTLQSTANVALWAGRNNVSSGSVVLNNGYVLAQEYGIGAAKDSRISVTGGVVEAKDNAALAGNGTNGYGGYTIDVSGGTLIGRITTPDYVSCGIYHPNAGTVSMSGGTIISTNGAGIVARAGQTNVSGGAIFALGDKETTGKVGDSRVVVGTSGIVLDLAAGYPGAGIEGGKATNASVEISGNARVSGVASAVSVVEGSAEGGVKEDDNILITGGSFDGEVREDFLPSGMKLENGELVVDEDAVATVGTVAYATLQEAIDNAASGQTVALIKNVSENVTIAEGRSITLDLNGLTLTNDTSDSNALSHTITNRGTLIIVDSSGAKTGTVDNVSHAKGALVNEGVVTIESGTLTRSQEAGSSPNDSGGNSWYVVDNQGTMTFTGGSVESKGKFSSLIRNLNGILNVSGGNFENGFIAIKNDDGGTLSISGGTISSGEQSVQNWSDATITGGTLTGDVISWSYLPNDPAKMNISGGEILGDIYSVSYSDSARSQVSITGGSITGQVASASYSNGIVIDQATNASSDLSVSGGTFEESPIDYVTKDGVIKINDDGTFTALERKGLPAGTYMVPEGAEKLTADDFQPGLSITVDENGNVVATKPYVPPVQSGEKVTVSETDGGTVKVSPERAKKGETVTVTATPDEGQEVRSVSVVDADGKAVAVKAGEKDGEFVFEMPDGAVTVTVVFGCDGGELCPTHGFNDVDQSAWYHDAVDWAVAEGVLKGYGEGGESLGPVADVTRAEMAQMLWNRAGRPEAEADLSSFTDVDTDGWYAPAFAWCVSEGIFSGYGDTFGTERTISREEAATVLWRIAGSPEADADLSGYGDASDVSEYATGAIEWAVSTGVLTGKGGVALDPQAGCTRGEIAAMMMRMAQ